MGQALLSGSSSQRRIWADEGPSKKRDWAKKEKDKNGPRREKKEKRSPKTETKK